MERAKPLLSRSGARDGGAMGMRFTQDFIDQVNEATVLSDLVAEYTTQTKKERSSTFFICPFHTEKTGSLHVTDSKGVFYCFGCHAKGNAIGFIRQIEGVGFVEAVERLASRAGMSPRREEDSETARERRRAAHRRTQALQEEDARKARRRHDTAAQQVSEEIKRCKHATHPYLEKKGFADAMGLVDGDGKLVVPVWNWKGHITSAQYIDAEGGKKFHYGGEVKGCYHRIGHTARRQPIVLCEGYVTGRSIHMSMRHNKMDFEIRACFSAGNMKAVGLDLMRRRMEVYAVADHDESGVGEAAAKAIGCPWWMPIGIGDDANDYARRYGVKRLAETLWKWLAETRRERLEGWQQ